ncbi:MAG: dockerin type I repeat-containing protein [Ruminococcus sp.]|nr:dockerin type I repeat-containing protein [Ruminococcus sp.]
MPSVCYFTCFDYSYETADRKDRSQFLIPASYSPLDEIPFEVTGNSELIGTGYASSGLTCDDIFNYYVYTPTGDGKTEFVFENTEFITVSAENGQYIPHIETGTKYYQHEPDGDVNGDGETGVADMVLLQKYLFALTDFTENQKSTVDFNRDGRIDVYDMIMMRKKFAK